MRKAHVLRARTRLKDFPERIISLDVETYPEDSEFQYLTLGWAVYRGRMGTEKYCFTTIDEFWDLVESKTKSNSPLTLIGYNVMFDLKALAFEVQLKSRGWSFGEYTVPKPLRITLSKGRKVIEIIDLGNFFGFQGVASVGRAIGRDKGEPEGGPADPRYWPENGCIPGSPDWEVLSEYCLNDALIVDEAFQVWKDFCKSNGLGSYAWTLAGQGLEAFRHRFMKHEIFIHDNDSASVLERASYHGGLTDAFWVGQDSSQEYYKVDVNSMYPSVMKAHAVPVKMVAYRSRVEDPDVVRLALDEGYAMTARVTVSYDGYKGLPFCGVVQDGKLIFPTGTFETVLTTPELRRVIDNDMLISVHEYAIYEQEVIFGDYVDYFYAMKAEYKASGNTAFYAIAKLFLNTLYGKMAQVSTRWQETDIRPQDYLERHVDPDGNPYELRRLGDRYEISVGEAPGSETFFAIPAHITAYARLKLIDAREAAGNRHAYYGDTDSLMVDAQGLENMTEAGLIDETELGFFSLEKTSRHIEVRTPKDYAFGDETRKKGIRKSAERGRLEDGVFVLDPEGPSYRQPQFEGILGAMRRGDVNHARVTSVIKTPTGKYNKGNIGPDGWVTPFVLSL